MTDMRPEHGLAASDGTQRPGHRRWYELRVLVRREVRQRARSRPLQLSTVLLALALVAGIVVPTLLSRRTTTYRVDVAPASATVTAAIKTAAAGAKVTVVARTAASTQQATRAVESAGVDAALLDGGRIVFAKSRNDTVEKILREAVTSLRLSERAAAAGLAPAQLRALLAPVDVRVSVLHPGRDQGPEVGIAIVGLVLLFTALNLYGSYVLMGVVEEKASRVVEVLLARTSATSLLAGKVLGIGAVGLAQFALLAAVALTTLTAVRPPDLPATTPAAIGGLVLWFVLGYAFYSVVYGALGALVSRQEDASAVSGPVALVLTGVYIAAFASVGSADSGWVTAASLFPPTAPMFMPVRAALTAVPAWQVGVAVALMLVALVLLVRVGGQLYRGGVLQTGPRLRLAEAWRAARER